jgi:hypothetical protein
VNKIHCILILILSIMARWYVSHSKRWPLWSKVWTAGGLYAIGDLIAQGVEQSEGELPKWNRFQIGQRAEAFNSLTSTTIFSSSPTATTTTILSQSSKEEVFCWDAWRTVRLVTFGCVFAGPWFHVWFRVLENLAPGTSKKAIFTKVVVDQLIGAPFFIGTFYTGVGLLESKSLQEIKKKLEVGDLLVLLLFLLLLLLFLLVVLPILLVVILPLPLLVHR